MASFAQRRAMAVTSCHELRMAAVPKAVDQQRVEAESVDLGV